MSFFVTPFAGVWIEIFVASSATPSKLSLPSRECGLKYQTLRLLSQLHLVTPFAGVWIEIGLVIDFIPDQTVTPFAGVWIEINASFEIALSLLGHSLRGSVD